MRSAYIHHFASYCVLVPSLIPFMVIFGSVVLGDEIVTTRVLYVKVPINSSSPFTQWSDCVVVLGLFTLDI